MRGARAQRLRFGVGIAVVLLLALPLPAAAGGIASGSAAIDPAATKPSNWIVTLKNGVDPKASAAIAKAAGGSSRRVYSHALHGFAFHGSAAAAAALRRNGKVRTVVPDGPIKIADTIPTGISRIRANHATAPSAYNSGFTGAGVKVAILDTGIDLTHPDLVPNLDLALGRNCITAGPPQDGHGHGSHVAGIVAAANNGIGVVGVAPEATLVPIKVLDDTGQGEWSNLICAIDYLTGLMTDGDPSNDVRVANMSLGDTGSIGSCTDGFVREAICRSVAAGVTYVAAAGNSTVDVSGFIPAAFPEVIAVSAITDLDGEPGGLGGCWLFFFYCDDTLAEFSNYGAGIDVTAPGTQIYSDWTGGGYETEMGTSMASPHVAGVAALILAAHPSLTPADVTSILETTGECPNGQFADADGSGSCAGKGQWGNDPDGIAEPLVNALNAVNGLTPPTPTVPGPPVSAFAASGAGKVTLTWSPSSSNGHSIITSYRVYRSTSSGAETLLTTLGAVTSYNDTAVTVGTTYFYQVSAVNAVGEGSRSAETSAAPVNQLPPPAVDYPGRQGNWVGAYGADGYVLANWNGDNTDLSSLPAGVTLSLDQGGRATWASSTTDVRALTDPNGTARRMQTWYDLSSIRLRLQFTNAYSGTLHLYAVDWDAYGGNRYQNVSINDGHGLQTASLQTSFVQGAWIHAPITVSAGGSVVITADKTAGYSAVIAGLFLGGGLPPTAPSAPNGVTATAGNAQVALTWTPPSLSGGTPITGYTATASPGGATCSTASLGCTVSGLTNGITYTFTVTATNAVGTGPASAPVSATPQNLDIPGVQGNWVGTYGADGYALANWSGDNATDLTSLPAGATLTLEQGGRGSWVAPTTDVRALTDPTASERRSRGWYDLSSMRLRLSFSAAYSGTLHMYAVDWDAYGGNRYENVTVDDGSGPRVAHISTSFVQGAWIHAPISVAAGGSVVITVDKTGGYSAVLSGLFLGGASTPPPPPPSLPFDIPGAQGNWVGTYGADGYVLANWNGDNTTDLTSLPAGATLSLELGARGSWVAPTTDVRALTNPTATERRARGWYDLSSMRLRLTFPSAYSGTLHLYAVDWDAYGGNRYENVTVDDGSGPRIARIATSFVQGAWIHAPISVAAGGSVVITVEKTGGYSAVLSGLFLGGATTPPPTAPGTPSGLTGTAGNAQVALSWTAPASNGGSSITAYKLYRSTTSGGETLLTTLGNVTSFTDTGLTNGATYFYQVSAVNSVGEGSRSAETSAKPATVPGAPTGLNATPGNAQVALAWTAPASNGGSAITGYTATASPGGATCATASLGCTITGLTNGTSYTFTVKATNAVGTGPASSPASATPVAPASVPGAPTGLTTTPGNAQVALTWTAPASNGGSPITSYTTTASPGGATCTTAGLGCTVTGLTNGTPYTFTVTATNAVGTGPASAPASATPVAPATAPDAPTGLMATAGNAQVALSWTAPASNGGSPITGYTATASPGGATCSTATLGCTVTGLTNGTSYSFTVKATNAVGSGPASSPASATPVAPANAPSAPTGLTATPGNGQVVLNWTAPASNGGSAITGYRIYRSTSSGSETLLTTLGVVTAYTNTGLTNGTTYYYQVTAINSVGEGSRSAEASARPATAPGAPRNVNATKNGAGGVALTWAAPTSNGGSAITGYRIYRSTSSGTETFYVAVGNVTSYVDTSAAHGVRYWYQLSAVNAIGEGPRSSQTNAVAR